MNTTRSVLTRLPSIPMRKISFPSYGDLLIPFLALEPKWPYDHFDWVRGYIIVDLIIKAAALAFRPLRPEEE